MDRLHASITTTFGHDPCPTPADLVTWDGFDQFEKEDAVRFYGGKTWQNVLKHLRDLKHNPVNGAAYYLEEWSVLNPACLSYYLRAHLEYLLETLASGTPDTEFVLQLLGQLQQVMHVHSSNPFTSAQTEALKLVIQYTCDCAAHSSLSAYQEHDIEDYATQLLVDLDNRGVSTPFKP